MQPISLKDFLPALCARDLVVQIAGHGGLAAGTATLGRVRGAMGHALALSASPEALAGAPCPYDPPCAYDLFHNPQGALNPGFELPKPFVLRADAQGADLTITLRLFGAACDWAPEFRAALIAGLRGGLDLGRAGRVPMQITAVSHAQLTASPPPAGGAGFAHANPDHPAPARRSRGAGPRSRLAADRICQTRQGDRAVARLCARSARGGAGRGAARRPPGRCGRTAGAGAGGTKPRPGFSGRIAFSAPPPELRRLLTLAEALHIGADTTIGAGRVRLTPLG
ncbi:CRISPR system precrRNA processing endoribonuclease RAMP protein Cas6 [Rhodobacter capsulatus]|uniref:CRISPR system precrRNA processing endoribonuclease RAMP protein Cas6 n=1 Tax=Rhodobacter capsulatus TaxID=1061 RepID=UPI0040287228